MAVWLVVGPVYPTDCKRPRAVWQRRLRGVTGARNPVLQEPDKLVSLGKDLGFHLSLLNNLGDGCEDLMAGQWQ